MVSLTLQLEALRSIARHSTCCDSCRRRFGSSISGLRRITWANQAAVGFWHAASAEQLHERNLGQDLSLASEGRLVEYARRLASEARISEQWTFYPAAQPVTVTCSFTPAAPAGEGPAFLVEASAVGAEQQRRRHATHRRGLSSHDRAGERDRSGRRDPDAEPGGHQRLRQRALEPDRARLHACASSTPIMRRARCTG